MSETEFKFADGNTKLTRTQLSKVYNKWISDNSNEWQKIKSNFDDPFPELQRRLTPQYGNPWWREDLNIKGRNSLIGSMPTEDNPGQAFQIENKGKDKVGFISQERRSVTRGVPSREGRIWYSSPDAEIDGRAFHSEVKAYNAGNNPLGRKLTPKDDLFRRIEHKIRIADPFWDTQFEFGPGDPENLTWTSKAQWKAKDSLEMSGKNKFIYDVDDITGDIRGIERNKFDPWKHTSQQGDIVWDSKYQRFITPIIENGSNGVNGVNGSNGYNGTKGIATEVIRKGKQFLKTPAGKIAVTTGALGLLSDGLEVNAAINERMNGDNSKLLNNAAELKAISGATGIGSIFVPVLFPVSAASKIAELHLRRRDKFEKNRYKTWNDLPSHDNLEIKQTPADAAVSRLELK